MSGKMVDKMKKLMGFEEEYDMENESFEEEVEQLGIVATRDIPKNNKIVNIHATTQMKVILYEPSNYEEVPAIVDNLKNRKAVIVNLQSIHDAETAKTIFDFLNGAIYALEGTIQKVSSGIFVLAPNNIDIDANIKRELENKVLFPWQK
ncbi:cell division inhibitor SepF [Peptoclostridium litorale DSM 5388]|uniref:Cell division protein SepF n=1 Tax=Peptoclostridium litorale DSM 5388 TaxID=1121324 RepID=A0A069RCP2_PEPLI|nr:cell division protein SepF [Peptoclostridium litorale]KDR94010.1 cell division protein SepF [Peptoclostridium litorale DSM 5388]SIN79533.1 cell division inhibitor SepF [Peptoclostridium litorale DSM 5388]